MKYISNVISDIFNDDLYLKICNDKIISNVKEFYIFLEDTLTKLYENEYNIFILNRTISRSDMFHFFKNVLDDYKKIYILDKNDNILYYAHCDKKLIEGITGSIF